MTIRTMPGMGTLVLLVSLLQLTGAQAVDLRFEPLDQNIALNDQGTLSIWLDDALEVRTIEVTVTFDGSILSGQVADQAVDAR